VRVIKIWKSRSTRIASKAGCEVYIPELGIPIVEQEDVRLSVLDVDRLYWLRVL
jgi:hypothetical protein